MEQGQRSLAIHRLETKTHVNIQRSLWHYSCELNPSFWLLRNFISSAKSAARRPFFRRVNNRSGGCNVAPPVEESGSYDNVAKSLPKYLRVTIHWNRFGPYHIARLRSAYAYLRKRNIEIVGLETSGLDKTYAWEIIRDATPFQRYIMFPDRSHSEIGPFSLFLKTWKTINEINPDIVVVAGYDTYDCLSLLAWAKFHRRPAIMMSETKLDDKKRTALKEWLKRRIIGTCKSALVGGSLHKEYMQSLGISPEHIFFGYDVVDNVYFQVNAEQARKNPRNMRSLPGLADETPFFLASSRFLKRKNLDGLLLAYQQYRNLYTDQNGESDPWRLIILGDGIERGLLESIIREKSIQGVTLAGFRQIDELPSYYGLASVFIHPALHEPWGLVVNEAMASGLPVLVSATVGCAKDLIVEGYTGYVFDPHNMTQLAELMIRVSAGEIDTNRMGKAAQMHIAEWGSGKFADGLYKAILSALKL